MQTSMVLKMIYIISYISFLDNVPNLLVLILFKLLLETLFIIYSNYSVLFSISL